MPSSEIATEALAITLFGPMQVRVQGSSLLQFRSRKALWLLAFRWPGRTVAFSFIAACIVFTS